MQFEITCTRSWEALDSLAAGELDIALVTQPCGHTGGRLVRREPLHWAVAKSSLVAEHDPLPLAIFAQGCIYRQAALAALDDCGRSWRLAYNSPSRDVLQTAVETGLAVTVLPDTLIGPNLRRLVAADGLPPLADIEILLYLSPSSSGRPVRTLAEVIANCLAAPAQRAA
jgi:DNA-binding transcriptional LysR family regulator